MAKLRRPLNSERARGSLGDVIFSESNNVNYARRKTIPRYEQTAKRKAVATDLTAASRLWSALTEEGKAKWEDFADSVTKSDVWGTPIKLPAFSWFVGCYMNLRAVGFIKPPSITNPTKPPTPTGIAFNWRNYPDHPRLVIGITGANQATGYRAKIFWNPKASEGTLKNKSELVPIEGGSHSASGNLVMRTISIPNNEIENWTGQHTFVIQFVDTMSGLASSEQKINAVIPQP